ncbi:MAG: hypothetical protein GKR98_04090 [Boseongicola sp.]|nr:MAG: hypothetical protein GKR98_04090 [Boseongicola sp.]
MIPGLWRAIYLERRRLAFVTILAFLAGFIFYARNDAVINGLPIALYTGLIYAAVIAPVTLLVCIFMPTFRFMIDAVAVSRFAVSIFVYLFPEAGAIILASPLLTAVIVVGYGVLFSKIMHGQAVRQKAPRLRDRVAMHANGIREPALINAAPVQHRFVRWVDDTPPVRA